MELKPAQEVFAKAIVNGSSLTTAYAQSHPNTSYRSCKQGGWLWSKKVQIKIRIQDLLNQHGLSLPECIKKLNELTEAKKFLHYKQGSPIYQPDNYIRLQAVQTALKIHVMLGNVQSISEDEGQGT